MRLTHVQVQLFRNIIDSTPVAIQPDVTCLVGRNESGKSTFLHAIYRLNPARPNVRFSVGEHYPAWREKKDRLRGRLDDAVPIRATFTLDDRDLAMLEAQFGAGVLSSPQLTVTRSYAGATVYAFEVNEAAVARSLVHEAGVPAASAERSNQVATIADLQDLARELARSGDTDSMRAAAAIQSRLATVLGDAVSLRQAVRDLLVPRVPKFFFFDEYATLTGRLAIRRLLSTSPDALSDEDLTGLSLLTLAGAEPDDLLNAGYERRRREMESVANTLTEDALKYWSQNTGLRVLIDLVQGAGVPEQLPAETAGPSSGIAAPTAGRAGAASGGPGEMNDELHIRLWDARHYLSLPFDQRSSGFRWFFSFLAAFAPYEHAQEPMVILLDEPALGLHARAQRDFLRFINERLAVNGHQVIYSTHSPFMVEADHLERIRIVEDRGRDVGSIVTGDLASADPESLYPLQGALGSSLAHDVFGRRPVLLVDSLTTSTYLALMSDAVAQRGGAGLDGRWIVLPAAGAQQLATMVALAGATPPVVVLLGSREDDPGGQLAEAATRGALKGLPIVTYAEVVDRSSANIEDLFAPGELDDLRARLSQPTLALPELQADTVDRFARLFRRLNGLLA